MPTLNLVVRGEDLEAEIEKARVIKKIPEKKKAELDSLRSLSRDYNTIMIVSISNLSSLQLQKIRKKLIQDAIRITKLNLLYRLLREFSLDSAKFKGAGENIAVIFTNSNIFELVKILNENLEKKFVKAGQIASDDIAIEAGNTSMMPGPIVTDLSEAGIKTGIEKGKVVIKERFIVKKGEIISQGIANALSKLNIKPLAIGLKPLGAFDKGSKIFYDQETLSIKLESILAELVADMHLAEALSLEIGYITRENARLFLEGAEIEAEIFSEEIGFITKENVSNFLSMAVAEAATVESSISHM